MIAAEDIARAMRGSRSGDAWRVLGVCHGARSSQSIIISDSQRGLRVHCFAGCEYSAVLTALGAATGYDLVRREAAAVRAEPAPVLPGPSPADIAARVNRVLRGCSYDAHPYLERKGFPDARVLVRDGLAVIPVRDKSGRPMSIQAIDADGGKRFMRGLPVKGGRFRIGHGRGLRWYCEGYATGLTLDAALRQMSRHGDSVVVCFSAANVASVAGRRGIVVPDRDPAICQGADRHRYDLAVYEDCPLCPDCGTASLPPTGEKWARRTGLPMLVPPDLGDVNDWTAQAGYGPLIEAMQRMVYG